MTLAYITMLNFNVNFCNVKVAKRSNKRKNTPCPCATSEIIGNQSFLLKLNLNCLLMWGGETYHNKDMHLD